MNHILLLGMPGGGELFVIVLVIIMFFGSKKIPELARGLGKGIKELKNATNDLQQEIRNNTQDINTIKDVVDVKKQVNNLLKEEMLNNKTPSKDVNTQDIDANTKSDKKDGELDELKETIPSNPKNTISRSSIVPPSQSETN